jgi:hypothetical protein
MNPFDLKNQATIPTESIIRIMAKKKKRRLSNGIA